MATGRSVAAHPVAHRDSFLGDAVSCVVGPGSWDDLAPNCASPPTHRHAVCPTFAKTYERGCNWHPLPRGASSALRLNLIIELEPFSWAEKTAQTGNSGKPRFRQAIGDPAYPSPTHGARPDPSAWRLGQPVRPDRSWSGHGTIKWVCMAPLPLTSTAAASESIVQVSVKSDLTHPAESPQPEWGEEREKEGRSRGGGGLGAVTLLLVRKGVFTSCNQLAASVPFC
jgi:hypothetical protein